MQNSISTPPSTLSFLYQTRTLQSSPFLRRWYNYHIQNCRNLYSADSSLHSPSSTIDTRSNHDELPNRVPYAQTVSKTSSIHRPPSPSTSNREPLPRPSTVTATEQRIFDRILKGLSQTEQRDLQTPDDEPENRILDVPSDGADLQSIFEDVIAQMKEREEQSELSERRNRARFVANSRDRLSPYTTRRLNLAASEPLQIVDENDQSSNQYETERQQHEEKVMRALNSAPTDLAVWRVLQTQVFSLVVEFKALDDQNKAQAVSSTQSESPPGKTPKRKHDRPSAAPLQTATYSILEYNYAKYLVHALRLLRKSFPTSPIVFAFLPTIKLLSQMSYVLGTSTALYNEILFLQWTQRADLHGMADILTEMAGQGIRPDKGTLVVLRAVARDHHDASNILREKKTGKDTWWSLRSVQEGWTRLRPLYLRIKWGVYEQRQEAEAEVAEAEVADRQPTREPEHAAEQLDEDEADEADMDEHEHERGTTEEDGARAAGIPADPSGPDRVSVSSTMENRLEAPPS